MHITSPSQNVITFVFETHIWMPHGHFYTGLGFNAILCIQGIQNNQLRWKNESYLDSWWCHLWNFNFQYITFVVRVSPYLNDIRVFFYTGIDRYTIPLSRTFGNNQLRMNNICATSRY